MAKEHVHAEEASHISTTLFTDLTHLSELEKLLQVWPKPVKSKQQLCQARLRSTPSAPCSNRDLDQMHALNGLLLLAIALSVLPSSAGALELGPCEPAEAVKIIDTSLGQGKTLQQAMQMMIKAKVFDGSKACITFIRETSMSMRDSYPRAFKSLWLN